jgi:hypothetical protein
MLNATECADVQYVGTDSPIPYEPNAPKGLLAFVCSMWPRADVAIVKPRRSRISYVEWSPGIRMDSMRFRRRHFRIGDHRNDRCSIRAYQRFGYRLPIVVEQRPRSLDRPPTSTGGRSTSARAAGAKAWNDLVRASNCRVRPVVGWLGAVKPQRVQATPPTGRVYLGLQSALRHEMIS